MSEHKKLSENILFLPFRKDLNAWYGKLYADSIWNNASQYMEEFYAMYHDEDDNTSMFVFPIISLYKAISEKDSEENAMRLLNSYSDALGRNLGKIIHSATSLPFVSGMLWKNIDQILDSASSEKKGYERRLVENGVDILKCPFAELFKKTGYEQLGPVICRCDKIYMSSIHHIRYVRTKAVAEGDDCCDYRLTYDENIN